MVNVESLQSLIGRSTMGLAELKEDIKKYGKQNFSRQILSIHTTLGKVNYEETRQLFVQSPDRIA